jgi:hypothetical protein
MDETYILSFIVRIWRDDSAPEEETNWRGHITLVPNGQRHYFSNIEDIPDFITAHIKTQRGD